MERVLFSRLQALRRNWHLAVLGLLATAALVVVSAARHPVTYVATTQMVLLPPHVEKKVHESDLVNPYLGLGGLQSMAELVGRAMMDDETGRALASAGVTDYKVTFDTMSAGPVVVAEASAPSSRRASDELRTLSAQVPVTLARLQASTSTSPTYFITLANIAGPSDPVRSGKAQLRAIGVALVGGLVAMLLAVAMLDAWRIRRRSEGPRYGAPAGTPSPVAAMAGAGGFGGDTPDAPQTRLVPMADVPQVVDGQVRPPWPDPGDAVRQHTNLDPHRRGS